MPVKKWWNTLKVGFSWRQEEGQCLKEAIRAWDVKSLFFLNKNYVHGMNENQNKASIEKKTPKKTLKNAQRDDGHLGMYKDCKCPTSETIECANQPRRTCVIQIKDMTR